MADINVERKRPSIWPWIVGLLVLALLIWAIAEMVQTEPEEPPVAEVEPTAPPAAVPPPTPAPPEQPVPLQTLLPLGAEDAGRVAQMRGTVVGQPTPEGYWLLTDQDVVLFVMTTEPRQTGQMVDVTGRLTPAQANQVDAWMQRAQLRPAAGWNVHREHFVAVTVPEPGVPPAPPQQPGGPPAQQPGAPPAQQ